MSNKDLVYRNGEAIPASEIKDVAVDEPRRRDARFTVYPHQMELLIMMGGFWSPGDFRQHQGRADRSRIDEHVRNSLLDKAATVDAIVKQIPVEAVTCVRCGTAFVPHEKYLRWKSGHPKPKRRCEPCWYLKN